MNSSVNFSVNFSVDFSVCFFSIVWRIIFFAFFSRRFSHRFSRRISAVEYWSGFRVEFSENLVADPKHFGGQRPLHLIDSGEKWGTPKPMG